MGTARIIQGDSRNLKAVIEKADLVVSSPPYAEGEKGHPSLGSVNNDAWGNDGRDIARRRGKTGNYGHTPGNLANMKEGSFDICVSSPPWEGSISGIQGPGHGVKWNKIEYAKSRVSTRNQFKYMSSEWLKNRKVTAEKQNLARLPSVAKDETYPTFWSASKEIVQGCHELLRDGGHAIWVTKDYVKAGKRVPFSNRWVALCESVGFKVVCWHHALLIEKHGYRMKFNFDNVIDEEEIILIERKSFFRRLAEKKGSPRIDWEDVICVEKK